MPLRVVPTFGSICCCYAALTVSSMSENDIVVGVIVDWYGSEIKVGDGKCVNI